VTYISGSGTATGVADPSNWSVPVVITMTFNRLDITSGNDSITISGKWTYERRHRPEIERMNIITRDNHTEKTYWVRDYEMLLTRQASYYDTDLTGRYYDYDHGYVEITTSSPLHINVNDGLPSSGVLVFIGDNKTESQLDFISAASYKVSADTDGDGSLDFNTGLMHWPGANTQPIADAGVDQGTNTSETISLNGSGSKDLDRDPLTYSWSIISKPDGSVATLSDPSVENPTFTPDKGGTYVISLVVNDGIVDSIADTVTITSITYLFRPPVIIAPVQFPDTVSIGDVNNDGMNDVVTISSSAPYQIYVYLQNLSGELNSPIKYPIVNGDYWSESIGIGDLNNDRMNDVVVPVTNGIGVFLQNNDGTLGKITIYTSNHSVDSRSNKLRIGDFNNDRRMDVASVDIGPPTQSKNIDVYIQKTDGKLNIPVSYQIPNFSSTGFDVGDVNDDGLTDIGFSMSNGFGVLLQNSTGTFVGPYYYENGNTISRGISIGDLNSDGLNDVANTNGGSGWDGFVGVFLQNSSGTFDPVIKYLSPPSPSPVVIADVNSDGRNDIIDVGRDGSNVGIFIQKIDGSLAPYEIYHIPHTGANIQPHGLAVGDINSDGHNDIVIADPGWNGLIILYHYNLIY
jgi:hypothetical protein